MNSNIVVKLINHNIDSSSNYRVMGIILNPFFYPLGFPSHPPLNLVS